MSNNYFKFKNFIIYQDKCAMKVSTDTCLLGASIQLVNAPNTILDIGTGTGILSLMMSQIFPNSKITALEIMEEAKQQANENIERSVYNQNIQVLLQDVNNYYPATKFDFIISNPPYFENNLMSKEIAKDTAKHSTALTLMQLASVISRLMTEDGSFSLIIPYNRVPEIKKYLLDNGLVIITQINIKHNAYKPIQKSILHGKFGNHLSTTETELILKNEQNDYTHQAKMILEPFYINVN
jgi:tRNA1Val (adenine37-N6)-methyltransferase